MLRKIFIGVLAVSVCLLAFFSYYSCSWLQSIGAPLAVAEGYAYHAGLAWTFLWVTTIILLAFANAVLWKTGRSAALWASFTYFALFVALRYFWLDRAFLSFQLEKGMRESGFSAAPLMAVVLIATMAAIVFFDMFIVTKLRDKTYGKDEASPQEENSRDETPES